VISELEMPPYAGSDNAQRMEKLKKFLEGMGW